MKSKHFKHNCQMNNKQDKILEQRIRSCRDSWRHRQTCAIEGMETPKKGIEIWFVSSIGSEKQMAILKNGWISRVPSRQISETRSKNSMAFMIHWWRRRTRPKSRKNKLSRRRLSSERMSPISPRRLKHCSLMFLMNRNQENVPRRSSSS